MYISLRDRPHVEGTAPGDGVRRRARARVSSVVVLLGLVSLLTDISSESVAAVLPVYLTAAAGLSMVAYGFVDGLYQGVSAVVRIGSGLASDRSDHPKWVAVVGYGLSCVSRVFLVFASGAAAISAVVAADRIGKGVRTAPRDAMIASASPTEGLARSFAVHRALDTTGAVIGPLLAFSILWLVPEGYTTVLVVSLAFAVMGLALLGLLVPDRRPRRVAARAAASSVAPDPSGRLRWRDVRDPRLTRLLLVVGALGLLTVGDGFIYLALLERGQFAALWFPLLYVGTNVAYLVLALPVGALADRVGRARMLVTGHVALVAAYACAALPTATKVTTLLALLLLGSFYAATDGVTAAVAGRVVPHSVRATGIASAQTVVAAARFLASLGFGVLWFVLGPQQALVLVGTLLAIAVGVALPAVARLDRTAEAS